MTTRSADVLVAELRRYGADCEVTDTGTLRVLDPDLAPDDLIAEIGQRWSEIVVALVCPCCPSLPLSALDCPSGPETVSPAAPAVPEWVPSGDPLEDIDPEAAALDGHYWAALLTLARPIDRADPRGLYGLLRGLRATGARLDLGLENGSPKLRLYPPPDEDPDACLAAIGDHAEVLGALLRRAGEEFTEEIVGAKVPEGDPALPIARVGVGPDGQPLPMLFMGRGEEVDRAARAYLAELDGIMPRSSPTIAKGQTSTAAIGLVPVTPELVST